MSPYKPGASDAGSLLPAHLRCIALRTTVPGLVARGEGEEASRLRGCDVCVRTVVRQVALLRVNRLRQLKRRVGLEGWG